MYVYTFFSILLSWEDWNEQRLPDKWVLMLFIVLVSIDYCTWENEYLLNTVASVWALVVFMAARIITNGKLGLGDVKYSCVTAYFLGIELWVISTFISCLAALVYGIVGIKLKKWKRSKKIPFGPFIAFSAIGIKILDILI